MRLLYLLLPLLPALTVLALPAGQDVFDGRQDTFDILVTIGLKQHVEQTCVPKFRTSLRLSVFLSVFPRFLTE